MHFVYIRSWKSSSYLDYLFGGVLAIDPNDLLVKLVALWIFKLSSVLPEMWSKTSMREKSLSYFKAQVLDPLDLHLIYCAYIDDRAVVPTYTSGVS